MPPQPTAPCLACGESTAHPILRLTLPAGGGRLPARIFGCRTCTHHFLPLTDEEQRRVDDHYDHDYAGYRQDPFFAARIRAEVADQLMPRIPAPARVLDVGCGAGEFMRAAAAAGYDVEGVDISEVAAEHCRTMGLQARAGDFLTMPFPGGYDIITMWDVMEHLSRPAAFLQRARELLAPGGIVVLKIPGIGPLTYRAVAVYPRLATTVLGAPGHQQYFTPRSLTALLGRTGFAEPEWLPAGAFRSKRPTTSLKKKVGRLLNRAVSRVAGNGNLYVAARLAATPARAPLSASDQVGAGARAS